MVPEPNTFETKIMESEQNGFTTAAKSFDRIFTDDYLEKFILSIPILCHKQLVTKVYIFSRSNISVKKSLTEALRRS